MSKKGVLNLKARRTRFNVITQAILMSVFSFQMLNKSFIQNIRHNFQVINYILAF